MYKHCDDDDEDDQCDDNNDIEDDDDLWSPERRQECHRRTLR